MASRKTKSSLADHRFPSFYACYLLKSIRTPRSTSIYIGSTPNPPRRIRQHNGEITQGAWKTKHNRPWLMTMIIHGFPSKLAALQFEWAWQHPHVSRHLRDQEGRQLFTGDRRSKYLRTNIQVAYTMLSTHPWSTWPLHVKLFTQDALRGWKDAEKTCSSLSLPSGFTCSTELEGVDGKSGQVGSGRVGPISVTDEEFTSRYLAKSTALLSRSVHLRCSICNSALDTFASDALSTSLCPTEHCSTVSHVLCLSNHFLTQQENGQGMIPRGGKCHGCHQYILWGDVIRGCYRRHAGRTVTEPDHETEEDDQGEEYGSDWLSSEDAKPASRGKATQRKSKHNDVVDPSSARGAPDDFDPLAPTRQKVFKMTRGTVRSRKQHSSKARVTPDLMSMSGTARQAPNASRVTSRPIVVPDDHEFFDLEAISSDEEEDGAPPVRVPTGSRFAQR